MKIQYLSDLHLEFQENRDYIKSNPISVTRDVLNSAFATELGDFIASSKIYTWIYGHSHTNIDANLNGTRILSNQLGYTFNGEHLRNDFTPSKFIEI